MKLKLKNALRKRVLACSQLLSFSFLFIVLGALTSCATYSTVTKKARSELRHRNYENSIKLLEKACEKERKNNLLCYYDLGMAYYLKGDYKNAIQQWGKADELAEQLDVVSISEQTSSLILDDHSVAYRGEHHEKILTSLYLGLSYLLMNKLEDALVECRRMNYKHQKLEQENEKKYKQNAFAKYLSGKMFEAQGELNEAFLYYREANELIPGISIIQEDLLRITNRLSFSQEYNIFKKQFKIATPKINKNMGELIFIFENGQSPQKISKEQLFPASGRVIKIVAPEFVLRKNDIAYAKIIVNGEEKNRTFLLNDIAITAKFQLNDRVKIRAAKMIGRLVAKEALAVGVAKVTDNEALGQLVSFGLQMMQRADTRSWLTLPANLQIGRIWLAPGIYRIGFNFYDSNSALITTKDKFKLITIGKKQKVFLDWRSFE